MSAEGWLLVVATATGATSIVMSLAVIVRTRRNASRIARTTQKLEAARREMGGAL